MKIIRNGAQIESVKRNNAKGSSVHIPFNSKSVALKYVMSNNDVRNYKVAEFYDKSALLSIFDIE